MSPEQEPEVPARKCRGGRFFQWLQSVPHLFSKLVVIYCIGWATVCSGYALRILSRTGHDATGLLAVILGFFGGELLLLCLKKLLAEPKQDSGKRQ